MFYFEKHFVGSFGKPYIQKLNLNGLGLIPVVFIHRFLALSTVCIDLGLYSCNSDSFKSI